MFVSAASITHAFTDNEMTINYRIFSDECTLKFNSSSQQLNFLAILYNGDANESYEPYQSTFLSSFNEHVPLKTTNISSKNGWKPWITPGILIPIHTKRTKQPYADVTVELCKVDVSIARLNVFIIGTQVQIKRKLNLT